MPLLKFKTSRFFKLFAFLMTSVLCFLGQAGTSLAQASGESQGGVLKLGFIGAMSGGNVALGMSSFAGTEYAVKKINEKGGLLGRKVELVVVDDACTAANGAPAGQKILEAGVFAVIGHTCSGATIGGLGVYGDKLVSISPGATMVDLTESGQYPNFFRSIPRDDEQSKLQAAFFKAGGYNKIALIHDNDSYGKGMAELTKSLVEASGGDMRVVLFDGVTVGKVDHTDTADKILASGADALMWGGYYADAAKIISILDDAEAGRRIAVIGGDGIKDDALIRAAGDSAEGVFAIGPRDLSGEPFAKAALDDYRQAKNEEPGIYYLPAIGAAESLFAAIGKVGNTDDLKAIGDRLRGEAADTALGSIKYDAKGDVIGSSLAIYQVRKGRFAPYNIPE